MSKIKLKSCCIFQEGYVNPSQKISKYFGDKYFWLRASDLNNSFVYKTERMLSEEGFLSAGKSAVLFKENTLAISKSGTIGEIGILKKRMCGNRAVINIDVNKEKADIFYIFYLLKYKKQELINKAGGSIQKNLYISLLETLDLEHSQLKDQQQIASALSTLDAKIELNNKINTELEAMAKTLYDYWFVQFDFPDQNGKPYKSSGGEMVWSEELKRDIPKGWEVKKISDLLPVITGKQDANFATENGEYNFFTCGEEILKCDSYEFEGKAVLVAGNGNFNIKLYEGKFNAYQRTYILIPNDERHYTLVYMAVRDRIASLTKGSRGSIVKFITKGDLEDIQVPLPKNQSLNVFFQLNTITKKIEKNLEENQKLADLRDFLLPMLMNGQVKVD